MSYTGTEDLTNTHFRQVKPVVSTSAERLLKQRDFYANLRDQVEPQMPNWVSFRKWIVFALIAEDPKIEKTPGCVHMQIRGNYLSKRSWQAARKVLAGVNSKGFLEYCLSKEALRQ